MLSYTGVINDGDCDDREMGRWGEGEMGRRGEGEILEKNQIFVWNFYGFGLFNCISHLKGSILINILNFKNETKNSRSS